MHDALSSRLLPHEWVFGGFLAATGLGLAFVAGPFARDTVLFFGLLAAAVALVQLLDQDRRLPFLAAQAL